MKKCKKCKKEKRPFLIDARGLCDNCRTEKRRAKSGPPDMGLADIRVHRNRLLAETDYMMMPDFPISKDKLKEIKRYRQALRDFPKGVRTKNVKRISDVPWPEKPSI